MVTVLFVCRLFFTARAAVSWRMKMTIINVHWRYVWLFPGGGDYVRRGFVRLPLRGSDGGTQLLHDIGLGREGQTAKA